MTVQAVLAPVFVMVALTFVLLFWMGGARYASVRRGETRVRDIALGQPAWPQRVQQISNCYHNQLQLPLLFYVVVILAYILHKADLLFVLLAWVFVVLRILHAAVHTGSNRVGRRFQVFLAGALVLLAMWVEFALHVMLLL